MKKLAMDELRNRGLDIDGQWAGFDQEKEIGKPDDVCPGCNHQGVVVSGSSYYVVFRCEGCGGLFSDNLPMTEMKKYVLVDQWVDSKAAFERSTYFDFSFRGADDERHRIHGWFDPKTKKLTQLG